MWYSIRAWVKETSSFLTGMEPMIFNTLVGHSNYWVNRRLMTSIDHIYWIFTEFTQSRSQRLHRKCARALGTRLEFTMTCILHTARVSGSSGEGISGPSCQISHLLWNEWNRTNGTEITLTRSVAAQQYASLQAKKPDESHISKRNNKAAWSLNELKNVHCASQKSLM